MLTISNNNWSLFILFNILKNVFLNVILCGDVNLKLFFLFRELNNHSQYSLIKIHHDLTLVVTRM